VHLNEGILSCVTSLRSCNGISRADRPSPCSACPSGPGIASLGLRHAHSRLTRPTLRSARTGSRSQVLERGSTDAVDPDPHLSLPAHRHRMPSRCPRAHRDARPAAHSSTGCPSNDRHGRSSPAAYVDAAAHHTGPDAQPSEVGPGADSRKHRRVTNRSVRGRARPSCRPRCRRRGRSERRTRRRRRCRRLTRVVS
jgi:hypothetical protein